MESAAIAATVTPNALVTVTAFTFMTGAHVGLEPARRLATGSLTDTQAVTSSATTRLHGYAGTFERDDGC